MSAPLTSDYWRGLQGVRLGGVYELSEWAGEDGKRSYYFTPSAAGTPRRVIAVIGGTSPEVEDQLRSWNIAAELLHPHLLRVYETGIEQVDGEPDALPLAYAVMDSPDEALAEVIRERALTPAETTEVVRALLAALEYLHARGLVHGEVDPNNIVSAAGGIQILNHALRVATDDPAWSGDPLSTAGDIRALGYTVYQLLTRTRDARLESIEAVPEPFRTIVRGCVHEKWTLRRVAEALDPSDASKFTLVDPVRAPATSRIPKWGYAAACLVGAVAAALMLFPEPKAATPPPPVTSTEPRPVVAQSPQPQPKAAPGWRVIAYTYARLADAEDRARAIRRRWPHLNPEVLKPRDPASPYQVSIGGEMTQLEALKLQSQARTMGLPRDTFARRY